MSSTKKMTLAIKTEHCTLAGSVREVDLDEPGDVSGDDWVLTYTPEEFYKLGHEFAALKGDANQFKRIVGRNIIDFIRPYYDDVDAHAVHDTFQRVARSMCEKVLADEDAAVDGIIDGLFESHRTHQQALFRVMATVIARYATMSEEKMGHDLRNEASVEWCKAVAQIPAHLPFL